MNTIQIIAFTHRQFNFDEIGLFHLDDKQRIDILTNLKTNLEISEDKIKGQFVYSKPNFNYSDNTLFTSIKSSSTDRLKDFGYETSEIGFSLGTEFEQYENLFFSPEVNLSIEDLETNTKASNNLKKQAGNLPAFDLIENKDILASVSKLKKNRPKVVIGFAAETENILENAKSKLKKKGCDFIVANDVSLGTETMGGDNNTAIIVSEDDAETLPKMSKRALAKILVGKISQSFEELDA